jgi:hypothetical protein
MSGSVFVVERFRWEPARETHAQRKKLAWMPGTTSLGCFEDQEEAEADCLRREQEARQQINPFTCGGSMHERSGLDEPRLRDWILDAGLEPPEEADWARWWDERSPTMTGIQRTRIWEALDKVRFFRVRQTNTTLVFVVAAVHWTYNDENFYRSADAIEPMRAFTTREKAEGQRRKLEDEARENYNPFQMNGLSDWSAWSSLSEEEGRKCLQAVGLEPPEPDEYGHADWDEWWEGTDPASVLGRFVWELCDKVAFYEVVEVEVPPDR